ncbi:MAG: type II secretion system protein GspK [Lentimicrobiaceae bacterium]|nr:type II secretion system protein GspK [Lentimicrobiaceae bacterium]
MKKRLLFLLLFFPFTLQAQLDSTSSRIYFEETFFEDFEYLSIEEETDFIEELSEFYETLEKININDLAPDVAFSILKISDYQYYQLQKYIAENGFLVSVYELASVEGFTVEYVQLLAPYITAVAVDKALKRTFKSLFKHPKHKLLMRYAQVLEKKAGYDKNRTTHYVGTPQQYVFRYNFSASEHITLGFSGKKNAGEEFFKGSQKQGFGFYSVHLQVKKIGILQSVIAGDYRLHFGQGMIMGNGFMNNASGEIRKTGAVLRPVTAMSQSNFLRGIALQLGNYKYNGTLFYGHRFYDGNVVEVEPEQLAFEGAISSTGLYRTEAELKKRNALFNRVYGVHFHANFKPFKVGTQVMRSEFSLPVLPSTKPYQYFDFSGKGLCNISVDYQVLIKHHILFGEFAASSTKGYGILQGAIFKVDPRIKCAALFRHYSKNFAALDGKPYSKNSKLNNETGLLLTSEIILSKKINMTALFDIYQFHWLKYLIDKPIPYIDVSLLFDMALTRNCALLVRYTYKTQNKNFKEEQPYNQILETQQHRLRVVFSYTFLQYLQFKSEISGIYNKNTHKNEDLFGMLVYQDVGINIAKIGLDFKLRLALFDTDTYDERLYAYENDLSYTFTINSYYYRGCKSYFILKWKGNRFEIQGKISRLLFFNKNQISSGLELIDAPHKTEVKVQMVIKL